jgi:hypothetical protein
MTTKFSEARNRSDLLDQIASSEVAILIYADSVSKAEALVDAFGPIGEGEIVLLVDLNALDQIEVARLQDQQEDYISSGLVDGCCSRGQFAEIVVYGVFPVSMVNAVSECQRKLAMTRMSLPKYSAIQEGRGQRRGGAMGSDLSI